MHNDLKQSLYKDCGELKHFFCTGPCNTVCKCRHARLYHIHDILQISKQTFLIPLLYLILKNLTALLSGHFFRLWSEMWIKCCNIFSGTKILTRQETEVILDGQTVYFSGKELAFHWYVCSVNTMNICTLIKNFLIFSFYCADFYDFLPIFSSTSNCHGAALYQQQLAYCSSNYPTN